MAFEIINLLTYCPASRLSNMSPENVETARPIISKGQMPQMTSSCTITIQLLKGEPGLLHFRQNLYHASDACAQNYCCQLWRHATQYSFLNDPFNYIAVDSTENRCLRTTRCDVILRVRNTGCVKTYWRTRCDDDVTGTCLQITSFVLRHLDDMLVAWGGSGNYPPPP